MSAAGGIVFSDEDFTGQLSRGRRSELHVAMRLLDSGFWVQSPYLPFLGREPGTYVDSDLAVAIRGRRFGIEVKGRSITHSDDPASYPYPVAFLDSTHSYGRKESKPYAYVLRSELAGGMVVALVSDSSCWEERDCPDKRLPGRVQRSWVLPRERLVTFDFLVQSLRGSP